MDDNRLQKEINNVRNKILIILVMLFGLFLNIAVIILPNLAFDVNIMVQPMNEFSRYALLVLSLGVYITYIYKFIQLYKGITEYSKDMLAAQKGENLIRSYVKYRESTLLETSFYSIILLLYIYIIITILV